MVEVECLYFSCFAILDFSEAAGYNRSHP
jgi:hypothetical protein